MNLYYHSLSISSLHFSVSTLLSKIHHFRQKVMPPVFGINYLKLCWPLLIRGYFSRTVGQRRNQFQYSLSTLECTYQNPFWLHFTWNIWLNGRILAKDEPWRVQILRCVSSKEWMSDDFTLFSSHFPRTSFKTLLLVITGNGLYSKTSLGGVGITTLTTTTGRNASQEATETVFRATTARQACSIGKMFINNCQNSASSRLCAPFWNWYNFNEYYLFYCSFLDYLKII